MPDNSTGSKRRRTASQRTAGFGFNAKSREAQRWAKAYAGDHITKINDETKINVRRMITESIRDGVPPRDSATLIREAVGLNRPQGIALRRYVRNLPPSLSTAAKAKAGIRLKKKMIRRRAITIARTEVIDSLSAGVEQSWAQAQGKGLLGKHAKKEWVTTPFGACNICKELNGSSVPLHDNFQSGLGPLARPTAHPNCRCGLAPVPGGGGALQPAALPPGVTQATSIPLTADGLIIRGADARRAILKYADSDEAVKQQKLVTAAEEQVKLKRRPLERELSRLDIDAKTLGAVYQADSNDIFAAISRAQRVSDDLEEARLVKVFRKREALYNKNFKEIRTKVNELNKELRALQKTLHDAIEIQADDVLETIIYNKTRNEMVETSTKVKLTKADKAELDRGIEAFRRLLDDGIYTTTVEGTPAKAVIVSQQTKAHVEFVKSLEGRRKTRGSRAWAHSDRDRAYRVKLDFKERSRRGRGTTVHELTHTVEFADPEILAEAIRWRDSLTTDDTLEWLGKLTGNPKYARRERAYGDGSAFKEKYIGKVYTESRDIATIEGKNYANQIYTTRDGWQTSTEVATMGMQAMYEDPVTFAREMPELFDFIFERVIRRKYTDATSKYALRVGNDFKLRNIPTDLTPEARKSIEVAYKFEAYLEGLPSTGRPGEFAQRLFELD